MRWLLDQLATAPLIFPGIVLGVAMIQIFLAVPFPIYGTLWAFIIAFTIRYLPYGMRYAASGILQVHPELEEAAGVAGSSACARAAPHRRPAGASRAAVRLAVHLSDRRTRLSLAVMLASPSARAGAVAMFDLWANGQGTELAAFGLVWTAIMTVIAAGFYLVGRRTIAFAVARVTGVCQSRSGSIGSRSSKQKVTALTAPRNAVLVGASDRPGSWAARVWRNLTRYEFPRPIYLVNPRRTESWRPPCYPDFKSLPEPPDHLVVLVPAPMFPSLCAAAPPQARAAPRYSLRALAKPAIRRRRAALAASSPRSSPRPGSACPAPIAWAMSAPRARLVTLTEDRPLALHAGPVALVGQSGGVMIYFNRCAGGARHRVSNI